jgi:hypothetical protein
VIIFLAEYNKVKLGERLLSSPLQTKKLGLLSEPKAGCLFSSGPAHMSAQDGPDRVALPIQGGGAPSFLTECNFLFKLF